MIDHIKQTEILKRNTEIRKPDLLRNNMCKYSNISN